MKKLFCLLLTVLLVGLSACGGEAAPKETTAPPIPVVEGAPIAQLDDVSVYLQVTGEARALPGLPDYVYSEGSSVTYKGAKEGRYGLKTHVFTATDAAAFITYLNALEAEGWQQYSNNIIEGTNLFATYIKDGASLYCYYISAKNSAYIVASPDQNLEPRQQDNVYEAVCQPQLTQIKLLCQEYRGGMSYLIRLSDGRFLILDGGYNENDYYHARQLYDLMAEQNVLPRITVAAWIISHPHGDHLGTAADFLRYYNSSQVELQQMIFNFPTDKDIAPIEQETVSSTHPSYMPTFFLALETLWPDLKVTVCHTGQVYHFADAKLEFLHTIEDFYPLSVASLSSNQVNGASAVFTMEIGGQKTMFLGDCAIDESKALVKMWGGYLKSDILQASYHCQRGGTVPLYEAIDPTVVLAPLPWENIERRQILSFDATRWLWENKSGNIKEIILSGWEQRTLVLPYTPAPDTPYFPGATSDPWAGL